MSSHDDFMRRYPHGVLVEQEGGVPNDVENWRGATHVCRKHRERERVCRDAVSDEAQAAFAIAITTPSRWDLIHDAVITDDDPEPTPTPEPREAHATTCDLLSGYGWRVCSCGLNDDQDVIGSDCA